MLRESAKVQLRRFHWPEIASFVRHLSPLEAAEMRSKVAELAPTGFQIWGIPSGAAQVLKDMETGDYLMLLESTDFRYVGQVIHRVSENCWDLSDHIWGEPVSGRGDRCRRPRQHLATGGAAAVRCGADPLPASHDGRVGPRRHGQADRGSAQRARRLAGDGR